MWPRWAIKWGMHEGTPGHHAVPLVTQSGDLEAGILSEVSTENFVDLGCS